MLMMAALVEVVDGRRPVGRLRRRLSGELHRRLRQVPSTSLGQRYVVRTVHVDDARPGVLEVCATVHALPEARAFAAAACLQAFWHGWTFTEFDIVHPPTGDSQPRLAA